jgi:hypothetical protein
MIKILIACISCSVVAMPSVYAAPPADQMPGRNTVSPTGSTVPLTPNEAESLKPKKKKASAKKKYKKGDEPNFAERTIEGADQAADGVAKKIDEMAETIDVTLAGGKKVTKENNNSSVTIKHLNIASEGGVTKSSTSFGINIRLPNLEKRWQVRFSSYDEEEEARDQQERRFRTRPWENKPGAAVAFFRKLGKVRTTFQPRLELKDPLSMSYILRLESDATLKPFHITPRLDLFADPEKGTGQYFRLNFGIKLAPKWELTFINDEEYRERTNSLTVTHGVVIDHSLTDDKGAALSFITNSTNRGGGYRLNQYTVSPTFAQELSENRLRYVAATFLTFTKAEAFKGDVGCSLQVELIF